MGIQSLIAPLAVVLISYASCGKTPDKNTSGKAEPRYRNVDSVAKVQVFTVDLKILTPIHIECGNFDSYFGDIKKTEVTRKTEQDSVLNMLAETRTIGKIFTLPPDTRGSLAISYTNGLTEAFCFDGKFIKLGDTTYYLSPTLKEYLWKVSGTPPRTK